MNTYDTAHMLHHLRQWQSAMQAGLHGEPLRTLSTIEELVQLMARRIPL